MEASPRRVKPWATAASPSVVPASTARWNRRSGPDSTPPEVAAATPPISSGPENCQRLASLPHHVVTAKG